MREKGGILLFLLVPLALAVGGFLAVQVLRSRTASSPLKEPTLADLRTKLTSEVRRCIIEKLGREEALKLAEKIRQIKSISPQDLETLRPCLESDTAGADLTLPTVFTKKEDTNVAHIKLTGGGTIQGYQYWLYENTQYPCGKGGNYEFLVLQKGAQKNKRNLLVRFHGGAAGFYYNNGQSYWPDPKFSQEILGAERERLNLFAAALDDGLAKRIRDNPSWRILVPSYCSHDFYIGRGQKHPLDGFSRLGYFGSKEAIDFAASEFPTESIVTSGTSAGASGAFYHGYQRKNVVGIVMDSFSVDFTAIVEAYQQGQTLTPQWPTQCDGSLCWAEMARRIGFTVGSNEPRFAIAEGRVTIPLYLIWNTHDALANYNMAIPMQPLHDAMVKYNPGGKSVAAEVCVSNPANPKRTCTIHSPTKFDVPETAAVYDWILSLTQE